MNLQLHEIINLNYELNGVSRQAEDGTTEQLSKGLLNQKTSLKVKVYLQRLNKIVAEEVKLYDDAKKELFQKYGTEEDGRISINPDALESFNKDHVDLLTASKKIDVEMLWSTDLTIDNLSSIETEEVYPVFLKLVDK